MKEIRQHTVENIKSVCKSQFYFEKTSNITGIISSFLLMNSNKCI